MAKDRRIITLSEHLGVTSKRLEEIGILNTNLGIDLKLFIDPKLVCSSSIPELAHSRERIDNYFKQFLRVNAQAPRSPRIKQVAIDMIAIKEPVGLCIGHGNQRDTGTSIPKSIAGDSIRSLNEMISVGFNDITIMEMLGLFVRRFGADCISDLIAHIVYEDLCMYTERICGENGFKTAEFEINGRKFLLPKHPIKNSRIVFLPLEVLSQLPLAIDWNGIGTAASMNASIRKDFNDLISGNIKLFIENIKKDPSFLTHSPRKLRTAVTAYSSAIAEPYNLDDDPLGYHRLGFYLDEISGTIESLTDFDLKSKSLLGIIRESILPQYVRVIEQLGANKLLYKRIGTTLQKVDETSPVHEEVPQVLFHNVADQVCHGSDIMLSRESKTAPGAVDFSLGTGYHSKVVVEIKKSCNKHLLDGYEKQLLAYEKAEAASASVYVIVVVKKSDITNQDSQLNELKRLHAQKVRDNEKTPELFIVNGLIQDSASKR